MHLRRNSWKKFYLTSQIKCNHWKELTKLVQNDLGTILIGWIVAEIFDLENTPKLLRDLQDRLVSWVILNQFSEIFSAVGFILWINKTTKACYWIILTLWSNPYMHNSCLGISPKYLIFWNAPKPIIDLCGISFLCANFETVTIFSAVVWKTCTCPPYYLIF